MKISREFIPFHILKEIDDPAYHIFYNAYASNMGKKRADELFRDFFDPNEALCDREMGWCIPDPGNVFRKINELDQDKPLFTETLPHFEIPKKYWKQRDIKINGRDCGTIDVDFLIGI